jgi:hypothetical protein
MTVAGRSFSLDADRSNRSVHLLGDWLNRFAVLRGLVHVKREHIVAVQAAEDLDVLAIVIAQSYLDQIQMAVPDHRSSWVAAAPAQSWPPSCKWPAAGASARVLVKHSDSKG